MNINCKTARRARPVATIGATLVIAAFCVPIALAAADPAEDERVKRGVDKHLVFPSPDAALAALLHAFKSNDDKTLLDIFGHNHKKLVVVTDKVARADALAELYEAAMEKHTFVEGDAGDEGKTAIRTLVLGKKDWPFPIPLVKVEGGWLFDTESGEDEIINRRIGANELGAIEVCDAFVDAQNEYADVDRDGDDVLEYAQRLGSTKGKRDGLYWYVDPDDDDAELSPFGPLLADAASFLAAAAKNTEKPILPFNGYYYKILTGQGAHVPGGEYNFIINGNMIAGFALVACPADYGSSGIMTLLVSHQGKVYEKDLGETTHEVVKAMSKYNPDSTWRLQTGSADDEEK